MSNDILHEVLTEFLEVWLHNVLYICNIYPSQIFRSRYKYNLSVKQSTYPVLNDHIRSLVASLQSQLRLQAIQTLTLHVIQDLEVQESFSLRLSFPPALPDSQTMPPEKVVAQCKDAFRGQIVSVLSSESAHPRVPREERSWSASVATSELVGCQMERWCWEGVPELDTTSRVTPLLFSDVGALRLQSLHRQ